MFTCVFSHFFIRVSSFPACGSSAPLVRFVPGCGTFCEAVADEIAFLISLSHGSLSVRGNAADLGAVRSVLRASGGAFRVLCRWHPVTSRWHVLVLLSNVVPVGEAELRGHKSCSPRGTASHFLKEETEARGATGVGGTSQGSRCPTCLATPHCGSTAGL